MFWFNSYVAIKAVKQKLLFNIVTNQIVTILFY